MRYMKQILADLQQKETKKMEEQIEKKDLLEQKERLDRRIKQAERKEIDDRIISSLRKIQDIRDSVSDLQNSLNIVWKRTQQVEEDLKEALTAAY